MARWSRDEMSPRRESKTNTRDTNCVRFYFNYVKLLRFYRREKTTEANAWIEARLIDLITITEERSAQRLSNKIKRLDNLEFIRKSVKAERVYACRIHEFD